MEGKTCSRYGNVDNCRSSCQRFLALKPRWTARWSSTSTGWSFSKVLQLKQLAMSACARFTVNEMHSSCSLHPRDQIQEMLVQISRSSSTWNWPGIIIYYKWQMMNGLKPLSFGQTLQNMAKPALVHCCIPVSLLIGGWDDQYKEPMNNTEII